MTDSHQNWGQDYTMMEYEYTQQGYSASPMNFSYDYTKPQMTHTPQMTSNTADMFQKLQFDLLVDDVPMEQGDGQQYYPAGELLPLETKSEQSYSPQVVQNNNNNNGYHVPAPQHKWEKLEPISDIRQEVITKEKVHKELDEFIKREKAIGYSANCLAKKENRRKETSQLAGKLQDQADTLKVENALKEDSLKFAVETVVIPFLGDNNSNIEIDSFNHLENQKEQIIEEVQEMKRNDEEFQKKHFEFIQAQEKLAQAEFDQKNKDVIPVMVLNKDKKGWHRASNTTLATRVNRSKKAMETCKADYEAAVCQYTIHRNQKISELLDYHWETFKPFLQNVLQYPPESLLKHIEWNGQVDQYQSLLQILFNPG